MIFSSTILCYLLRIIGITSITRTTTDFVHNDGAAVLFTGAFSVQQQKQQQHQHLLSSRIRSTSRQRGDDTNGVILGNNSRQLHNDGGGFVSVHQSTPFSFSLYLLATKGKKLSLEEHKNNGERMRKTNCFFDCNTTINNNNNTIFAISISFLRQFIQRISAIPLPLLLQRQQEKIVVLTSSSIDQLLLLGQRRRRTKHPPPSSTTGTKLQRIFLRKSRQRMINRCIPSIVVACTIFVSTLLGGCGSGTRAGAAVDNGRMGGSFGRSSSARPSISRSIGRHNGSSDSRGRSSSSSSSSNSGGGRITRNEFRSYSSSPSIRRFTDFEDHRHQQRQALPKIRTPRSRPRGRGSAAPIQIYKPSSSSWMSDVRVRNKLETAIFVGTVASIITYQVMEHRSHDNNNDNDDDDPLFGSVGSGGVSVFSLTTCLNNVSSDTNNSNNDHNNPTSSSIIRRIEQIASRSDTTTRMGVQEILSLTILELLRQLNMGTIKSIGSEYYHYRDGMGDNNRNNNDDTALLCAERRYNQMSLRERCKFDRESWSNYNGNIIQDNTCDDDTNDDSTSSATAAPATYAIVQIHVILEGTSMEPYRSSKSKPQQQQERIQSKTVLQDALYQLSGDIASSSIQNNCSLIAGEVLWAPQRRRRWQSNSNDDTSLLDETMVLTDRDIYAMYPTLHPLEYTK